MNRGINKNRNNSFFLHLKKELGGFLLLIFLFPQINNALHYFVVEHHFHEYNRNEKQFHHNHKTHNCEQSIFKIPSVLLFDFGYSELKKYISFFEVEKPLYKVFYKKIIFDNASDRGPPQLFKILLISTLSKF